MKYKICIYVHAKTKESKMYGFLCINIDILILTGATYMDYKRQNIEIIKAVESSAVISWDTEIHNNCGRINSSQYAAIWIQLKFDKSGESLTFQISM